jgi:hypothetical protein
MALHRQWATDAIVVRLVAVVLVVLLVVPGVVMAIVARPHTAASPTPTTAHPVLPPSPR